MDRFIQFCASVLVLGLPFACSTGALWGNPETPAETQETPRHDAGVRIVPHDPSVFRSDPSYGPDTFEYDEQRYIYGDKWRNPTQRPLIAWGNRPLYSEGDFYDWWPPIFGEKNPFDPQLLLFGDWKVAAGLNDNGAVDVGRLATQLTLNFDLKLTATERIHTQIGPLDKDAKFTRVDFAGDLEGDEDLELDLNADALFFEGDLGAMAGGAFGTNAPFDLPFAAGKIPLLLQNGVWLEDAITGFAFTVPARNSSLLNISNFDVTFIAGFDENNSGAILDAGGNDHDANIFAVATFIEANNGYWEAGYGFTDGEDDTARDLDYHNLTLAYSRRYEPWISNSVRGIWNVGQDRSSKTADGFLLLVENSLITRNPSTVVPYLNIFAGFNRPQSLARGAAGQGVLKNTGINFESDRITAFPKLDDSGHDVVGGALGLELLLDFDIINPLERGFAKQLVFEVASLHKHGSKAKAPDDELAIGARFQWPVSHQFIFRADAMYGLIEGKNDNLGGIRFEFRWKF